MQLLLRKALVTTVALLLMLSLALAGCAKPAPSPAPSAKPPVPPASTAASTPAPTPVAKPPAASPAAAEPIKVGINLPLSGSVASMGNKGKAAFEVAAKKINDAGGIKSMGGAKLQLIIADNESKDEVTGRETERLVTREKVNVIVGAYLSGLTTVGSEVAEKYKMPWVNWIAMTPKLTQRGFKYYFRPGDNNELVAPLQIGFLKHWGEQTGISKVKYFDVYVDDAMGQTAFPLRKKEAEAKGLELVGSAPLPSVVIDFTPVMLKIKAAKPDALFVWQHEEQAILITKSMAEHKIDVACIESYGTFLNAPVIKAVGQLKEGWFEISLWNEYMTKDPWVMELAKDFKAHSGAELDSYSAQALQSLYVLADALERAASRDPEAIRNALAATKIKKGDKAFICGYPIEFDASGQNQKAFTAVNQTWEGKIHPMYPADAAAMEPGYKPVWKPTWAWLKK